MNRSIAVGALVLGSVLASGVWANEVAWLGVVVAPVPEPVAAHLGLEDGGLMVVNVAADSPADKAGIERFDVVVRIGDQPVPSDVGWLIDTVRRHKPGEQTELTVQHQGKQRTVTVELAAMPDDRWLRYESDWRRWWHGPKGWEIRGKVLRRGPEGWEIKDLDEQLKDVPEDIRKLLRVGPGPRHPGAEGIAEIAIHPDGRIRVLRMVRGPEGKQRRGERVYDNPEELKRKDPAAYEVYLRMRGEPPGPPTHERWWQRQGEKLRSQTERAAEEARRRMEDLTQREHELRQRLEQWQQKIREYEKRIGQQFESLKQRAGDGVRFEVEPDGRIRATVRRGADELVVSFKDEAELKQKRPELYEKLLELRGRR
jgi:hypothetical protein